MAGGLGQESATVEDSFSSKPLLGRTAIMAPVDSVLHLCAGVALFLVPYTYWSLPYPFFLHPILMSVAFITLMGEGVVIASKAVILPAGAQRLRLLKLHMWIQIAAVLAAAGGFWAIYANKDRLGKKHFTTLHGQFGAFTLCLTLVAPAAGVLGFRYLGLAAKLPDNLQGTVKLWHRRVGILCVVLGAAETILGFTQAHMQRPGYTPIFCVIALTVASCAVAHYLKLGAVRARSEGLPA
eukprot:Hpha_TRINITY_DN1678_c0_g1::TRINITY_DN1678_c0_g1_i1::g.48744::m.48744/K08371/CYB561D2; cytochrome b-561 domain containing protein 2